MEELVCRDCASETGGEAGPEVLPGFDVAVDDIEGLITGTELCGGPEAERGVQLGGGEGGGGVVEGRASRPDEGAGELFAYGDVEAEAG